ncbi:MAG: phage tail tape measure protein [Odoribacter sp.]
MTYNYIINVGGNAINTVQGIADNVSLMNQQVSKSVNIFQTFEGKMAVFNQASEWIGKLVDGINRGIQPGADLNASLADLSAITGETGEGLKRIEDSARSMAKTFGGSAVQGVESYKLILSQLGPEIAKTPAALKTMGENVAVLSKTMGGNTVAATEVLATAMNQFQVSLTNPIAASKEMANMMNIMAAAAKEGSSELPVIKAALEQCGMAAKMAGVSFSETNAAIQVLDKAGKKGSEGGISLRNVMATLAQGRFLPKDVQEELQAAGVDMKTLTNQSLSLSERLRPLQRIMGDSALVTKLFGKENNNAALALLSGIDQMDSYNKAIQGTNTAFEQADVVMESYNEKMSRIRAKMDDLKIIAFNLTGSFLPFLQVVLGMLTPLARLYPLLKGITLGCISLYSKLGPLYKTLQSTSAFKTFHYQMLFMRADMQAASLTSLGFKQNMIRAGMAVLDFGTRGVWAGIKGIGALIASLFTGGAASAGFSATASASFGVFKLTAVSACRAVGVAIKSIPIIGWIAALIGLIVTACVKFDSWGKYVLAFLGPIGWLVTAFISLKRNWQSIVEVFQADGILGAIKRIGIVLLDFFLKPIQSILELVAKIPGIGKYAASGVESIKNLRKGFNLTGEEDQIETDRADQGEAEKRGMTLEEYRTRRDKAKAARVSIDDYIEQPPGGTPPEGITPGDGNPDGNPISDGIGSIGGGGGESKIRNINTHIGSLIEHFEIHTANIGNDMGRVKTAVAEALVSAVNDLNTVGL